MNSRSVFPTNICPQVLQFTMKLENTIKKKKSQISQVINIFFLPTNFHSLSNVVAGSFVTETEVHKAQKCKSGRDCLMVQVAECHCGDWILLLPSAPYANEIINRSPQ